MHHHEPAGLQLTVDDLDIPDDLDWSLSISELLKKGTERAHIKAEHSAGAAALVEGTLRIQDYVRWLVVLWRIYRYVKVSSKPSTWFFAHHERELHLTLIQCTRAGTCRTFLRSDSSSHIRPETPC